MIKTYYRILKHDPEGKLIKDSGLIESHSYVIQFLEMVEAFLKIAYPATKTATDVDNAESIIVGARVADESEFFGRMDAGVGADTHGIVVGTNATGPTAEANDNYKLDTKILHSAVSEAGKLNYQATIPSAPAVDGVNVDFDIIRPFLNETENPITVREIGIICKNTTDTKYHLLLRDVVADEVVGAGLTLTVVYTLRTTV